MRRWFASAATGPVVRRALASALLVGPVLIAINHGDAIVSGDVSAGLLLRIVLTMVVPYAVSTFSSVQAMPRGSRTDTIRTAKYQQASRAG